MASKKKVTGGKRPQNLRRTRGQFSAYLGRHRIMIGLVALLAAISALAALFGTYMIRPVVNGLLENGSKAYLAGAVGLTACIYIIGALSTLGYTQLMVRAAQKVLQEIRQDLFAHLQTQPLQYFDTHRNGDLMSLFTNDVDTISDALNNSFAVVIQTFIQVVGTLLMLFILNWRLSLLVAVGYVGMFWYINFSTQHSRAYYAKQQSSLGELDAYIEEMIAGQKVVKAASGRHRRAKLCCHDGARRRQHRLHQLRGHCGAGRPDGHEGLDRPGQPGQLSGVCAPDHPAHQPVYPAGQLPAGGAGRCRAYFYRHGAVARS